MNYQEIMDFRNSHNPFAERLGIRVTELSLGYAKAVKTVTGEDLNPVGRAHGGCLVAMADTACGSAAASRGFHLVTLSANYNFLSGGSEGDILTATAREIRAGRTIGVYEVALTNQKDDLLGTGIFTFYLLDKKIGG